MTLTGRLMQAARIMTRAAAYREAIRAEAVARQARAEREEAARLQRAQDEFEDDVARGLAEGNVYFPSDRDGGPGLRLLSLEEWRSHGNEDVWERR